MKISTDVDFKKSGMNDTVIEFMRISEKNFETTSEMMVVFTACLEGVVTRVGQSDKSLEKTMKDFIIDSIERI